MAIFQIVNEGMTLLRKDKIGDLERCISIPTSTLLHGPILIDINPPEKFGIPYIPNKLMVEPIMFLETSDTKQFPLSVNDLKECIFNFVTTTLKSASYAEMLTGKEIQA